MTEFTFLVVVALLLVVVRLYLRLKETEGSVAKIHERLRLLEIELCAGRMRESAPKAAAATPAPIPPTHPVPEPAMPPPLPSGHKLVQAPSPPPEPRRETIVEKVTFPTASSVREAPPAEGEKLFPAITIEAFMGVKLFAWLGGLALFLGVIFFVKYSFEHNLITAQMRVALGALTGIGLVVGGLLIPRPKFAVTAQTLCATGIVSLYGVTFGAYSLYHFIGLLSTFAFMAAITGGAFLVAVQMNAQVVAILGLLGGFLTPIMLSTGQDNPAGLFTYLAVLDAGLIAVALRQRWLHLVALAAVATALMQLAWTGELFTPDKVGIGAIVFLGFEAFFLFPFWQRNNDAISDPWTTAAAGITAGTALCFAAFLLDFAALGQKPWIVLSIALAADAGLVAWPLRRTALQSAPLFGGAAAFLILSVWNVRYLSDPLLYWALGYFLVFAAFHTALPILLRRLRPAAETPRWAQIFPALGLVLMLWPALRIGASTALWAAVLIADLAAIALAALTASLLGVVAALVLTLLAVALWLAQTPVENPSISGLLAGLAGFAARFCGASVFLQRRLAARGLAESADAREQEALHHLPAISAVLPFLLLVSVVHRLHPLNPSAIFGVGMLLVVMLLALARWSDTLALPPVALGCAVLLEHSWHIEIHPVPNGWLPLAWYLGFAAVIAAFAFLFQSRQSSRVTPWATAALSPVPHYLLINGVICHTWPDFAERAPGLIPAAFAVPALAACDYLRRSFPRENAARLGVLAWFVGVALLFITLIFPAQFQREWLTISWALEGAALLWLFHRLPHPGLRLVGFGLLCVAFARLALNPAVLSYHARSGAPIWNWYLYTYGIGAACFFAGGGLVASPRNRLGEINLPATLFSLGTILIFLLLNIEIADSFSTGATLTFDFSGNLARDMTYSIAWSLFALGLLLVGMHRQLPAVRYAGIGLLVVTLVKLFVHDLAQLDQLYRIGAFVAVAVVLIGASYLYQRFLAVEKQDDSK